MKKGAETKKTSKTPKTLKYYYTKASILRSATISILCAIAFIGFFTCFLIYGGASRNPSALYKIVSFEEKKPLSMISEIDADGEGRVYVFYKKTFEINAYSEDGKFKESYQIPCFDSETEAEVYEGGIVCENGVLYAFNEAGDVYSFKNGMGDKAFDKTDDKAECERIIKLHSEKNANIVNVGDKTFINNFAFVSDGDGNVLVSRLLVGLLFSPVSMVMAIIMTVMTYLAIRRYNKKVRNQKINTLFKNSVTVK